MKFLKQWWPTLIVVGVIVYATLSNDPTPDMKITLFPGADKLIHAIMFGGFAGAMAFDWQRAHKEVLLSRRRMMQFCLIAAGAGILDEISQIYLTVARSGEVLDYVGDCVGITVAFFTAPPAVRYVLRVSPKN